MNADLGMERSYYVATANSFSEAPALAGETDADVVVIGGGYTGLHAALNAAERGFKVVLLEAGKIGWGASGRNGGQMIPGWRKDVGELSRRYGPAHAKLLFDLALEARKLTLEQITKHNIQCDLVTHGHLTLASKPSALADLEAEADALQKIAGYPHAHTLSPVEAREAVAAEGVHGGLLDLCGGHLHPLNYALGLAEGARRVGVRLYEQSAVVEIKNHRGVAARTAGGVVRARYGVLACDALLGKLEPSIAGRIMPVANYLVATAPLPDREALIGGDLAVSDSRFVVDYFRMSADGRLIFGGGERYTADPPSDFAAFVRPFMLRLFPQLANARLDYAWGGLVSITMTRMPHIGRLGELFFAHGYSGQGVLMPALVGKVLSEAMAGAAERFDVLTALAPPEFPGGATLRAPLHVLGMIYYALRDRL